MSEHNALNYAKVKQELHENGTNLGAQNVSTQPSNFVALNKGPLASNEKGSNNLIGSGDTGDNGGKSSNSQVIADNSKSNKYSNKPTSLTEKPLKTNGYFDGEPNLKFEQYPFKTSEQSKYTNIPSAMNPVHFDPFHQKVPSGTSGYIDNASSRITSSFSSRSGMQSPTVPFVASFTGQSQSIPTRMNMNESSNNPGYPSTTAGVPPGSSAPLLKTSIYPPSIPPSMNTVPVNYPPSMVQLSSPLNQVHPPPIIGQSHSNMPPGSSSANIRPPTSLPYGPPYNSSQISGTTSAGMRPPTHRPNPMVNQFSMNSTPGNIGEALYTGSTNSPQTFAPSSSGTGSPYYQGVPASVGNIQSPSSGPSILAPPPTVNRITPAANSTGAPLMPPPHGHHSRGSMPPPVMPQSQTPQVSMYNTPPGIPQTGIGNALPPIQPPTSLSQYGKPGQGIPPVGPRTGTQNYPRMSYPGREVNQQLAPMLNSMSVKEGFNRLWGQDTLDLMQQRNIYPPKPEAPPRIVLPNEHLQQLNCSPEIFRCTLNKIPETSSLLSKCKLPLGVLIHPFKDLAELPVIQCSTIVRCRSCRTYINPFVYFVDQRRWKCNLCFKVNDLPEEFLFDPNSKTYGDPTKRPEVQSATIEFIAPSEYMLRPPQPSCYLYIIDVCYNSVTTGHLEIFCKELINSIREGSIPGDSRTLMGFITVDSTIHFYSFVEGMAQPHMMVVGDIDDVFVPSPDTLLVSLQTHKDVIISLLEQLPTKFNSTYETQSALGAALQAGYKMMSSIGGRITVLQTALPNYGPGALQSREDPNSRASKEIHHLTPATDFYKKLALDCSSQQIAVDLFVLATQYVDLATLSGVSKFSGGCIYYYPTFHHQHNKKDALRFQKDLNRYLTRKIGYESVMRIRCTRGLAIHTFHGNFFVRSTDLLSLPNINPDAGFGMQISIEESLNDIPLCCFQAALLYTSSQGERRIRVHTLCIPVSGDLNALIASADQECIIGLLSKMAVDRCVTSNVLDAREALLNAVVDSLSAYRATQTAFSSSSGLLAPPNLKLLPLYVLSIFKHIAFRIGVSTRLDERVWAMNQLKTLPLGNLLIYLYPNMYPVHSLSSSPELDPPRLQLSAEKIDAHGAYILDTLDVIYLFLGKAVTEKFCSSVLNCANFLSIPSDLLELPEIQSAESVSLRNFVQDICDPRPVIPVVQVIRDDTNLRSLIFSKMMDDRSEAAPSYIEFLQKLRAEVK